MGFVSEEVFEVSCWALVFGGDIITVYLMGKSYETFY